MPVNKDLLLKIKEKILNNPAAIDMGVWKQKDLYPQPIAPACGTTACLAGWACELSLDCPTMDFFDNASKFLQLEERQAYFLFYHERWPRKFERAYEEADNKLDAALEENFYSTEDYDEVDLEKLAEIKNLMLRRAEVVGKLIDYAILHDGNLYQDDLYYESYGDKDLKEFPDMETMEL